MNPRALGRAGLCAVLALLVALGGCAQMPWGSTAESGTTETFEAFGRVYVRYGARAFSGTLRWRHAPEADEVWLGGPLGQTAAHIVRDGSGATDVQVMAAKGHPQVLREPMAGGATSKEDAA